MTCKQKPSPSQTLTLEIWRRAKETLERSLGPFSTVLFKMISMRSDKPICAPTRLSEIFAALRLRGRPDVTVVVDWALKINYLSICLPAYLSVSLYLSIRLPAPPPPPPSLSAYLPNCKIYLYICMYLRLKLFQR